MKAVTPGPPPGGFRRSRIHLLPLYLNAVVAAACADLLVRILPLDRAAGLLGIAVDPVDPRHAVHHATDHEPDKGHEDRVRATLAVMKRWPLGDTCLKRAIVMGHLLRNERPRLVIGVARDGEAIAAHAWIEIPSGSFGFDGRSQRLRRPSRELASPAER